MPETAPAPTARQIGADDRRAGQPRMPSRSARLLAMLAAEDAGPREALAIRKHYLAGWDDPDTAPALPPVHDHGPGMWSRSCPACVADVPHPEPYAEVNLPADWQAPTA